MKLIVSGIEREFENAMNLNDLIDHLVPNATGVAVAVNEEVVRRSGWPAWELRDGDRIEIVRAVQGG